MSDAAGSSEALLSGHKPSFRLLVQAVNSAGEPVDHIRFAVSEAFRVSILWVMHQVPPLVLLKAHSHTLPMELGAYVLQQTLSCCHPVPIGPNGSCKLHLRRQSLCMPGGMSPPPKLPDQT